MIRIFTTLFLIATITLSCSSNKADYQLQIFKTSESEWGYLIHTNNKTLIYQEHIPCIAGKKAFMSERDAKKTGELVIQKVKNGQLPTINIADLKKLGIRLN